MGKEITVVHVEFPGNWEALYVDGERVAQNHSVSWDALSELEGYTIGEARHEWRSISLSEHFGAQAPEMYAELDEVE